MSSTGNLYIIVLELEKKVSLKIGRLGVFDFLPGHYFYVGSAKRAPEKRIARHRQKEKALRWHIDYITVSDFKWVDSVLFKDVVFTECELAEALKMEFGLLSPVKKFGSSDCRCFSHLFFKSVRSEKSRD